jgi:hypothetical protein
MKLIALLLLGSLLSACDQKQPPPPAGIALDNPSALAATPMPRNGRYVIVFSPIARADTFLLDTQKGKVWQLTRFNDLVGEPLVWDDMGIIDNSADIAQRIPESLTTSEFLKLYSRKGEKKK